MTETLAIRSLELTRAAFAAAVEENHAGRFIIRNRARVVKRHPEATGERQFQFIRGCDRASLRARRAFQRVR